MGDERRTQVRRRMEGRDEYRGRDLGTVRAVARLRSLIKCETPVVFRFTLSVAFVAAALAARQFRERNNRKAGN
ncbi:MAG: hypothetical protein NNA21_11080, partial [Nitrospira sp.]|nr:hypothetical protein [Nitrospira sp.]